MNVQKVLPTIRKHKQICVNGKHDRYGHVDYGGGQDISFRFLPSHQTPLGLWRRACEWAGEGRESLVIYEALQASLPLSSTRSFAQVEPLWLRAPLFYLVIIGCSLGLIVAGVTQPPRHHLCGCNILFRGLWGRNLNCIVNWWCFFFFWLRFIENVLKTARVWTARNYNTK